MVYLRYILRSITEDPMVFEKETSNEYCVKKAAPSGEQLKRLVLISEVMRRLFNTRESGDQDENRITGL